MVNQAIIALNGQFQGSIEDYKSFISTDDFLIAADGGARLFAKLGYIPDIIIGDFDSLKKEDIEYYSSKGTKILEYPRMKDETDGELALKYCIEKGYDDVIITGSLGGRFDQQLANIFLLEYAIKYDINAIIREAALELGIINHQKILSGKKGQRLSLLPLSRKVSHISLAGCKYKLDQENLYRYKTRGISNIVIEERATISVGTGKLLYIIDKHKTPSC